MMESLKNRKAFRKAKTVLTASVTALENASNIVHHTDMLPIQMMVDEKRAQLAYLLSNKQWNFNFEGGGWNSVYAPTEYEAIKKACAEYDDPAVRYHSPENGGGAIQTMKVNKKSFRIATEADTANLLSMFY